MFMNKGKTVYDRVKQTGYMMGSGHKMGSPLDEQNQTAEKEPDGDETKPPNLRDSIDSTECCGTCANFNPNSEEGGATCSKYGDFQVSANQICDGYEEKKPDNGKEMLSGPEGSDSGLTHNTGF